MIKFPKNFNDSIRAGFSPFKEILNVQIGFSQNLK